MRTRCRGPVTVMLVLGTLVPVAVAHDFWVEPADFRPEVGALLHVRLLVGHGKEREEFPRSARHLDRFVCLGPGGTAEVPGITGQSPAGILRPASAGLHLIVYRSRPSRIRLEAAAFERYLAEEGLERISALRKERGQSETEGRETYSRCAKALVAVGGRWEGKYDAAPDLPLDVVPQVNPYDLTAGGELPMRVLLHGAGLEGARVAAYRIDSPATVVSSRTDAEGRARLRLDTAGRWIVKCVHMLEAKGDPEADWESLWASLTFELRAPAAPPEHRGPQEPR